MKKEKLMDFSKMDDAIYRILVNQLGKSRYALPNELQRVWDSRRQMFIFGAYWMYRHAQSQKKRKKA